VATLSGTAQAARLDARRLRIESEELKARVRGNVARSRERLEKAQVEAERARARCVEPLPSPWSELCWTQTYDSLEQTLVLLP
jgi:hypothetical protein